MLWCAHSCDPHREIHSQPPGLTGPEHKTRAAQSGGPFRRRVIADMRSVAEQFNGLKMSVEQGRRGRTGVDEDSRCATLQNPVRLAEFTVEVAPVMRRVTAREEIETAVFERQILWELPRPRYCRGLCRVRCWRQQSPFLAIDRPPRPSPHSAPSNMKRDRRPYRGRAHAPGQPSG